MGYIENLMKQLSLTANEKKELNKIRVKRAEFQRDLKIASLSGGEDRREQTLWIINDVSERRKEEMKKVWKRRIKALIGK